MVDVETSTEDPWVALHTGEKVYADVIVAADGMVTIEKERGEC